MLTAHHKFENKLPNNDRHVLDTYPTLTMRHLPVPTTELSVVTSSTNVARNFREDGIERSNGFCRSNRVGRIDVPTTPYGTSAAANFNARQSDCRGSEGGDDKNDNCREHCLI